MCVSPGLTSLCLQPRSSWNPCAFHCDASNWKAAQLRVMADSIKSVFLALTPQDECEERKVGKFVASIQRSFDAQLRDLPTTIRREHRAYGLPDCCWCISYERCVARSLIHGCSQKPRVNQMCDVRKVKGGRHGRASHTCRRVALSLVETGDVLALRARFLEPSPAQAILFTISPPPPRPPPRPYTARAR